MTSAGKGSEGDVDGTWRTKIHTTMEIQTTTKIRRMMKVIRKSRRSERQKQNRNRRRPRQRNLSRRCGQLRKLQQRKSLPRKRKYRGDKITTAWPSNAASPTSTPNTPGLFRPSFWSWLAR